MALEQMEGFELAGRTVSSALTVYFVYDTLAAASKHGSRERNCQIYPTRLPRRSWR